MGKNSSSMTTWCRWRDKVSRQGLAKHRQRGGGRRAGLRRGRGRSVSLKGQNPSLFIGGGGGGAPPLLPSWPPHLLPSRAAAPPRGGKPSRGCSPSLPLYIVGTLGCWRTQSSSPSAQPCSSFSSSLPVLGEALPGDLVSPSTPRRRAAGLLPQPLPPPCWIKVRETSPGCMCVERVGAVVRH